MELLLLALLGIGASTFIFSGDDDDAPSGEEIEITDEETVTGTEGNDTIAVEEPNFTLNLLEAGDGNDLISLTNVDNAEINGGEGNDTITGQSDTSTISGGDGDDEIDMRPLQSTLLGGAGNDVLSVSQSFNDSSTERVGSVIYSGPSFVSGGDGDDTINYDVGTDPRASAFQLSGGDGADSFNIHLTTTDYGFTNLPEELLFEYDDFGNVIAEVETPVVTDTVATITDFEPGLDHLEIDLRDTHDQVPGAHTLNGVNTTEEANGTRLEFTFDSARPDDPDRGYQLVVSVFLENTFGLDMARDVTLLT